jgi:hypothetical protein
VNIVDSKAGTTNSISSREKTEKFQILRAAHKLIALKVRGNHCIQLEPQNHTLNLGRASFGKILIFFIWGRVLRAKFLC